MTDSELRGAAERVQAWSRFMTFGVNSFTTKNQMAEAMDAVASKLLELLPVTDDASTTGPPFDAWSFIRDVLVRGTNIEQDSRKIGRGYEMHSTVLDAAARELADRLKPHLRATEGAK